MRSKKKHADAKPATIFRSIKSNCPDTPSSSAGLVGQAAVTAAARHQLYRYAQEIEDYLESAKLDALLNQLQTDMNACDIMRQT